MSANDNSVANANKKDCSSKQIVDKKQEWKDREVKEHNNTTNLVENYEEINEAFVFFDYINNTVNICKRFFSKHSNGVDYFCSLCNCIIENSSSDKKFRFTLWSHLNEETHSDKILHLKNDDNNKGSSKQVQEWEKLACVKLKNALTSFELGKQEKETPSKQFIVKKSECNAYHCKLCDVEILYSSDNNELRFNLHSHINEKNHRFQLTTVLKTAACYKSRKTKKGHGLNKKAALKKCKTNEDQRLSESTMGNILEECGRLSSIESTQPSNSTVEICTNKKSVEEIFQAVETSEKENIDTIEETKREEIKAIHEDSCRRLLRKVALEKLKKVFDSFEQSNPVSKESKKFIHTFKKGNDYYCSLCDVRILCPLNDNELKFNLWFHINMELHRAKLPNYKQIIRSFETEKGKIFKSLPTSYKADADYFMIGPVFGFAKCSLCNVAVSLNFHRLLNHIKRHEHTGNRTSAMFGEEVSIIPPQVRSGKEYAILKSEMDSKFGEDMKFIQPGTMPGYVICIVCCYVVLATKYHLEIHFEDKSHIENCTNKGDCSSKQIADDKQEWKERDVKEITHSIEDDDEIDAAFVVFQFINNTINICENVISKHSNGVDYVCNLCNCIIEHSSSDKMFRFTLWNHLTEETHSAQILHLNKNDNIKELLKQAQEQNKHACVQLKNALASFELGKQEKETTSKQFITKKGECNAYYCKLCDVEILYSSYNEFRFNLHSHINEKNHKFKLTTALKTEKTQKQDELNKKGAIKKCKTNEGQRMNDEGESTMGNILKEFGQFSCIESSQPSSSNVEPNNKFVKDTKILKAVKNIEEEDINTAVETKPKEKKTLKKSLVRRNKPNEELKKAFDSFELSNPVTNASKNFIHKIKKEKDYYCTLCDVCISYPLNDNEFRFSLWSHINTEIHREKLPNYSQMFISFELKKEKISKSLPELYKADADYLMIGPLFKFAKCSLCNVAVSLIFARLVNHIKGREHTGNRRLALLGRKDSIIPPEVRSGKEYAVLKSKIDDKFNEDMKLIQPGIMPGYVTCIACCQGVIATTYHLETHFEQDRHIEIQRLRPVKKSKVSKATGIMKAVKTSEGKDIDTVEVTKLETKAFKRDMVVQNKTKKELKEIFHSFDQSNPVTNESKKFIYQFKKEKDYHCTLCDVRISCPSNDNEFRFNLWSHINMETHWEKLPNYTKMVRSFETAKENFFKSIPELYKADADYFMIGPFAKCSLCNVAVSLKHERLFKHIRGQEHTENRLALLGRKVSIIPPEVRCGKEYAVLKSKIDGKFSKDVTFIQSGVMAGYVICIACCQVVIANKCHLETHFQHKNHIENPWLRLVNKSKISLDALMQNMPEDLKAYKDIFVEVECGVRCSRCQEVIPATTCKLYDHITKERTRI